MAISHFEIEAVRLRLPSSSKEKVAILAIHGRNQGADFMINLIDQLGWQNCPAILPVAAEKSWYPGGFMESLDKNGDKLNESLKVIAKYHQELNNLGYEDEQILFLGFSQGACLASQYCLLNPRKYYGIVILTGGYVGPEGLDWSFEGDFKQTPIFISTS
uniref:alpha/beta hydrolase n=1 Tax=Algoriphagus sp. TaxID=1872435 RepID=UPI0025ECAFD0